MSDTDPYMAPDAPNVESAKYVQTPAVDSFDQTVAEKPVEAPVADVQTAPEGSIKEVLAWVGDDATKAQTALDAEKTGEKRTTLISKLEAVIN
jgi:hypothetical protein